jgi:hypothetical protein
VAASTIVAFSYLIGEWSLYVGKFSLIFTFDSALRNATLASPFSPFLRLKKFQMFYSGKSIS